tara:strand:- start:54 stop:1409 length:1356 start_codon:yes stop_codon:yes gene_type:complete
MPPSRRRARGSRNRRRSSAPSGRSAAAQNIFKKSVSKARSRGIDSRSLAQKNAALEEAQRRAEQQARGSDDNRSSYLAKQATQPLIDRNKFLMDQEKRRADILSGKITPKKSDFTGFEGGIFGLRTGNFTDTNKPKIREGLTSAQYADFMRDLYDKNPQRMEKMFPFASGKMVRDAAKFAPIIGPITRMADSAKEKGKGILSGVQNKLSEAFSKVSDSGIAQDLKNAPGGFISDFKNMFGIGKKDGATTDTAPKRSDANPYDASGLEGYRDAIMRMNQTVSPLSQNFYGGRSPIDETYAGLPSTQFGKEFLRRMGPREGFTTNKQPTETNQASSGKLNVNMLNLLSPTLEDFRENMAGTEPFEQPVLDFAMNRAPSSYNQTLEMLQNKYPGRSPMEYVTMMDQLQKTPNFQRTLAFNENFLPSANTPIQFAEGGSVGNFNLLKETNDEMHG